MPEDVRGTARDRFRIVVVEDPSARAVASKLLDRLDLLEAIRSWIGDDPTHVEPWNVAEPEVEVALRLEAPINGTPPALWPLGFKSAGRSVFRKAGVPVPAGFEHLESVDDAVEAIDRLRVEDPAIPAVILKHDDSGAGDGNAVIRSTSSRTGRFVWSTSAVDSPPTRRIRPISASTPARSDAPWPSGATHPFTVLRHLAPGAYDPETGVYTDDRG